MEAYNFSEATTAVYAFWQYEVCDVFIELMKVRRSTSLSVCPDYLCRSAETSFSKSDDTSACRSKQCAAVNVSRI
jgi:valyl-tRNA synthetase